MMYIYRSVQFHARMKRNIDGNQFRCTIYRSTYTLYVTIIFVTFAGTFLNKRFHFLKKIIELKQNLNLKNPSS